MTEEEIEQKDDQSVDTKICWRDGAELVSSGNFGPDGDYTSGELRCPTCDYLYAEF